MSYSVSSNYNNLSGCIPSSFQKFCSNIANINLIGNNLLAWNGNFKSFCDNNGYLNMQEGAPCGAKLKDSIIVNCQCIKKITPCIHPDYNALMALYNSTNGDKWINRGTITNPKDTINGWGKDCDPCKWFGVACNDLQRVDSISLASNNLLGTISQDIGKLTHLRILNLSLNKLSGIIPTDLSNLTNLTGLFLYRNQLTGFIPEDLGKLANLTLLNLSDNQLTGPLHPELGQLTKLKSLFIVNTLVSGNIPPNFGNLENLKNLFLAYNLLSGNIPPELGKLSNLEILELGNNELSSTIPADLGKLTNLNILSLNNNMLSGVIPSELGNLKKLLTRFNVQNNLLSGCLPNSLHNLCNIEEANISGNSDLSSSSWTDFCSSYEGVCPCIDSISNPSSICSGSNLVLNAGGGFDKYLWSNGSTSSSINAINITTNSIYSVTVSNDFCRSIFRDTIFVNPSPKVAIDGDLMICEGQSTQLKANPNGGFAPYLFSWNPADTNQIINVNPTVFASYKVTVTDKNKCTSSDSVAVQVFPKLSFIKEPRDTQVCKGATITLSAAANFGGVGGSNTLKYQWQESTSNNCNGTFVNIPNATSSSYIIPNVEATKSYRVIIDDGIGNCDSFISSCGKVVVSCSVCPNVTPQITATNICDNQGITISSISPFNRYKWFLNNQVIPNVLNQSITINQAGSYKLEVTDEKGCTWENSKVVTGSTSPINTVIKQQDTVCNSAANGNTIVNLSLLRAGDNGLWRDQNNLLISNPNNIDFNGKAVGEYTYNHKTNNAILPCQDKEISVQIIVQACDNDCSPNGCYGLSKYKWINPPKDTIVFCDAAIPSNDAIKIKFTNECTGSKEHTDFSTSVKTQFKGDTIIGIWEATTKCNQTITYQRKIVVNKTGGLAKFIDLPNPNITADCKDLDLHKKKLKYSNGLSGVCKIEGEIDPVTAVLDKWCNPSAVIKWSKDNLTFDQKVNFTNKPIFDFLQKPKSDTIQYTNLPYKPIKVTLSNGLEGSCKTDTILSPTRLDSTIVNGTGELTYGWKWQNPCNPAIVLRQEQKILVCQLPQLKNEFSYFNIDEISKIDVLKSALLSDSFLIKIVKIDDSKFDNYDLANDGIFSFVIKQHYFDTLRVKYEVCELNCQLCAEGTLLMIDEAVKEIIPTTVFSPNNDGVNDVLKFSREPFIENSELRIYNRWCDQIYKKSPYTNDWDARDFPGGVYFYVLTVNGAVLKKSLTIIK